MNILMTNLAIYAGTGTEMYVRDLAVGLQKQGNTVEIYAGTLGPLAVQLMEKGINVVSNLHDLKYKPDLIHGQHCILSEVLDFFRNTPAIYFCHDRSWKYDEPIVHPSIKQYVAVDYLVLERIIQKKEISHLPQEVIYNWVDTNRFRLKPAISDIPSKALIFSNYASPDNWYNTVKRACDNLQIPLDCAGKMFSTYTAEPHKLLQNYDIVFAKAKCAMEAMAVGCAAVLCDYVGLGEMVLPENFNKCRKFNFGRNNLAYRHSVKKVEKEIQKYNRNGIETVTSLMRNESSLNVMLPKIIALYHKVLTL